MIRDIQITQFFGASRLIAVLLTTILGLLPLSAVSADSPAGSVATQAGWELTYKRIFSEAGLGEHDSLAGALGRSEASAMPIFAELPNEPIQAAIFIDTVAFCSGTDNKR